MVSRRRVLRTIAAVTFFKSAFVFAQRPLSGAKIFKIGTLAGGSANGLGGQAVDAFRSGMRDLGYIEGRHYVIDARFAEGHYERYPALATDLVTQKVDVIVAIGGGPATRAAQQASRSIPIIVVAGDPVASGFAKSLARPGGNVTGLANFTGALLPKQLELLVSVIPRVSHIGLVANPNTTGAPRIVEAVVAAASVSKVRLSVAKVETEQEIESAIAGLARDGAQGVLVGSDPMLNAQIGRIADVALKHRLASITVVRRYVEAGGLMSYGEPDLANYRRAAYFVDRIFKGAKPQDLPIEQPTQFELGINLKTAKALGIVIPQALVLRADKVIE